MPGWHFSLTEEDRGTLERVQKVALKVILKSDYKDYDQALEVLGLDTLDARRSSLCLKFAKKCLKNPTASAMFPLNEPLQYSTRHHEKYKVQVARTDRLKDSFIPQMQRALNADATSRSAK